MPAINNDSGQPPTHSPEVHNISEQVDRVTRLFKIWLEDESGYDEETWPKLKAALEEDHYSARRLFDE